MWCVFLCCEKFNLFIKCLKLCFGKPGSASHSSTQLCKYAQMSPFVPHANVLHPYIHLVYVTFCALQASTNVKSNNAVMDGSWQALKWGWNGQDVHESWDGVSQNPLKRKLTPRKTGDKRTLWRDVILPSSYTHITPVFETCSVREVRLFNLRYCLIPALVF